MSELSYLQTMVVRCFQAAKGRPPNMEKIATLTKQECKTLLEHEQLKPFYEHLVFGTVRPMTEFDL